MKKTDGREVEEQKKHDDERSTMKTDKDKEYADKDNEHEICVGSRNINKSSASFVPSIACRSLVVPVSGSAPALTIFALVGVLFLGGVLRCRAPWPWDARTATLRIHRVSATLSSRSLLS